MSGEKTSPKQPLRLFRTRLYDVGILFLQGLLDVSQDVVDILDADGEADEVGCYAGFTQLFVA